MPGRRQMPCPRAGRLGPGDGRGVLVDQGDAGARRRMDPADHEQGPGLGTCRTGAQRQEGGGTAYRTDHGRPAGQRPASVHLSLHRAH